MSSSHSKKHEPNSMSNGFVRLVIVISLGLLASLLWNACGKSLHSEGHGEGHHESGHATEATHEVKHEDTTGHKIDTNEHKTDTGKLATGKADTTTHSAVDTTISPKEKH